MKTLIDTIKHNQTLFVSILVCICLVVWGYGCQPETKSPRDHTKKVTRPELDIEIELYAKEVSMAYADLDRQEQIRNAILNAGLAYAKGEGPNILGLISTLSGILGIGAVVDNRRKDAVIKSKTNALNALANVSERGTT